MGNSDSTENQKSNQGGNQGEKKKSAETETNYWGATWDLRKASQEEERKKKKK